MQIIGHLRKYVSVQDCIISSAVLHIAIIIWREILQDFSLQLRCVPNGFLQLQQHNVSSHTYLSQVCQVMKNHVGKLGTSNFAYFIFKGWLLASIFDDYGQMYEGNEKSVDKILIVNEKLNSETIPFLACMSRLWNVYHLALSEQMASCYVTVTSK